MVRKGAQFVFHVNAIAAVAWPAALQAQKPSEIADLRSQIEQERAAIESQEQILMAQRTRLLALEARLGGPGETGSLLLPSAERPVSQNATAQGSPVPTVGQAPKDKRQVEVAVLSEQGGIITKSGRMTIEADLEYAHADRNRVLFRGIAIPEAVLIGAFDINESRQDVVTAAAVLRYGLTNRLEINGRLPYVRRSDNSALAPVVNNGTSSDVGTDLAVTNGNLGDVDFGLRYQISNGNRGWPYLIVGLQAVAPTGTDPFKVPRDGLGNPLRAATGSGFWGVTPTLTAILPTDPAVLFGTLGYTVNFGRHIGQQIGSAIVDRVTPGGEPAASLGIAISLNPRTSVSLGYAHTLAFGTRTRLSVINPQNNEVGPSQSARTRDLQLGRFLFGVSYRTSQNTTINWNIEVGVTDDATDLRTTLRVPFSFGI